MNIIAAVDQNWAIGMDNKLLARIPDDMKRFRQMTLGKAVVLGRKTLETFPEGRPLQGRTNIVLSRNRDYQAEGAVVVHSLQELSEELAKYKSGDIFVVGGGSVYRQLLEQCGTAYITRIGHAYRADAWFPDLDRDRSWQVKEESDEQAYFGLKYSFVKYIKK